MWTPRFLRRNRAVTDPDTGLTYVEHNGPDPEAAYRAGRAEQLRIDRERVEARRRRRSPGLGVLGFLIILLALAGGGYLTLAAREGSFTAGGAAVDRQVAAVTTPAREATQEALDRTGASLEQAGQAVETQGKKLRDRID
jgi:hypothetical protein